MSVEGSVSRNVKNNSQHDAIPAGANVADDRAPAWGAPGPNRRDRQPAKRGLGVGWSVPPRPLASGSAFGRGGVWPRSRSRATPIAGVSAAAVARADGACRLR